MGNLKNHVGCKRHPKHKQSPGVCSLCLSEKLSRVSKTRLRGLRRSSYSSSSSSSSLSSEYSSSSPSSCSSPTHRNYHFSTRERNNNNKGSLAFMFSEKNNVNALTKSRSMAFVPRRHDNDDDACSGGDCKKKTTSGGFLSKLLHPRRKKIENGLVHSRTMRERVLVAS